MSYAAQSKAITPETFATPSHGVAGDRVVLIHANDYTGHRAYYFLLANPLRFAQLQKILLSGKSFDLESYGDIIATGYGQIPEHVRADIRKRYGWKG